MPLHFCKVVEIVYGESVDCITIKRRLLFWSPNPNDGNYVLRVTVADKKEGVEISIFDISGKLVFEESKYRSGSELKIKSDLQKGTYLLKVKLEDGTYDIHRLVISE